ncbi:hypothetical protein ABH930_007434 [Kitasatospora sp. GAS204A]|uniref:hypothetical protein n=1 Tax=unclassified Kitasatospora TaxID=2633591 RepID=UPI002473F399|nr:hypothetical protein [Kitasatospora sp. GAS204B]MDH6123058.1 hypothetical protein [Kitasatospora sp. GAS204B]
MKFSRWAATTTTLTSASRITGAQATAASGRGAGEDIVRPNTSSSWSRRVAAATMALGLAGAPLFAAAPATAATTSSLLYSADNGATWSSNPTIAPGATVLVRAWYNNADPVEHTGAQVSTTLPPGFTLAPNSTMVCLNPTTPAGSEATPTLTEADGRTSSLVCNTDTGQSGAIDEAAVWTGSTLTISPTAGLFGQPVGATSGVMEFGKKRYFNMNNCDRQLSANGPQLMTSITAPGLGPFVAGSNVSNSADTVPSCPAAPGWPVNLQGTQALDLLAQRYINMNNCVRQIAGTGNGPQLTTSITSPSLGPYTAGTNTKNSIDTAPSCPAAPGWPVNFSGTQPLDMLGNRYLNLNNCVRQIAGTGNGPQLTTTITAPGVGPYTAGTNTKNSIDTAPSCPAAPGWPVNISGTQAFDTLDTARGAGFVQFAMNAPTCLAAQTATVTGTGFTAPPSTSCLTITRTP